MDTFRSGVEPLGSQKMRIIIKQRRLDQSSAFPIRLLSLLSCLKDLRTGTCLHEFASRSARKPMRLARCLAFGPIDGRRIRCSHQIESSLNADGLESASQCVTTEYREELVSVSLRNAESDSTLLKDTGGRATAPSHFVIR